MTRSVFVVAIGLSMAQTSPCVAQFRLDIVQAAKEVGETSEESPADPGEEIQVQELVFVGNINGVVFGNGHNNPETKRKLTTELETTIAILEIEYQLTPAQKKKLWLAGLLDLVSIEEDSKLIQRLAIDAQKNRNEFRNVFRRLQQAQLRIKDGAFSDDSMMSKVSRRILLAQGDDRQGHEYLDRNKFAYQAALKLIVAQLELVVPLRQQQRLTLLQRINEMDRPSSLTAEMVYSTAIKELMKPVNAPDILDNEQLAVLKDMRKSIVLGRLRPHGLIKSRSGVVDSLRR